MKLKKSPIEVFDYWVKIGKDDGLEKNHASAVSKMIEHSTLTLKKFSFIDAGCGNGWLVRHMSKDPRCSKSIGIDGSKRMIKKAKKLDGKNEYICSDLLDWKQIIKWGWLYQWRCFIILKILKNLPNTSIKTGWPKILD